MSEAIKQFKGKFRFLDNFFPCKVTYDGITYKTSEAAFQAAKTLDDNQKKRIADLDSPMEAKRYGQRIPLRKDWEAIKVKAMEDVVYAKFQQNPKLRRRLLETGDSHLEEGNHHGDEFWGTVDGKGYNKLGFVLMRVRDRIRQEAAKV